jgi:hypothetical protein
MTLMKGMLTIVGVPTPRRRRMPGGNGKIMHIWDTLDHDLQCKQC